VVGSGATGKLSDGDATVLFVIYGAGSAAAFGVLASLYWHAYARRRELDLNPPEVVETRFEIYRNLALGAIGLLSAASAVLLRAAAPRLVGLAGFVYFAIGLTEWVLGEKEARLKKRLV